MTDFAWRDTTHTNTHTYKTQKGTHNKPKISLMFKLLKQWILIRFTNRSKGEVLLTRGKNIVFTHSTCLGPFIL